MRQFTSGVDTLRWHHNSLRFSLTMCHNELHSHGGVLRLVVFVRQLRIDNECEAVTKSRELAGWCVWSFTVNTDLVWTHSKRCMQACLYTSTSVDCQCTGIIQPERNISARCSCWGFQRKSFHSLLAFSRNVHSLGVYSFLAFSLSAPGTDRPYNSLLFARLKDRLMNPVA